MKILLALFLLTGQNFQTAGTFEIVNPQIKQGDTLIVNINPQWRDPGGGINVFGKNYTPNKFGRVFIGIAVDTLPGKHSLFLTDYGRIRTDVVSYQIEVVEKEFPEWFRGRAPVLSKTVEQRLEKDRELKEKAYKSGSVFEDHTSGQYIYPLEDIFVTSEFGSRRIYGSYSKNRKQINIERVVSHGGVDLRARIPTEVRAINSGWVILARRLLADGNLLIIDHGSGVVSMYLHLSRLKVKEGDTVKKGQIIAYTGSTGGVPPHLDFRIKVWSTDVDPLEFIENYNKNIAP